jgi:hypothetical protein
MAISEINARAAINFRMTHVSMLRNIVRVLPKMGSFNRERVISYAISAFAFLCEFGGNPSFLLILDALLWRRRGKVREQEPSPAIAMSDG